MKALLTLGLFSMICGSAQASQFDLKSIAAIIADPQVKTVEDFVSKTPLSLRADNQFTLAYHPHGLVSGSAKTPSVLLFGGSDSMVEIVFTSQPTTDETIEDSVEILAFDPEIKRHELARISFRKGQRPALEVHPHKCLVCHGDNPKPLWRSSFEWEGFFGANGGVFSKRTETPASNVEVDEQALWTAIVENPGPRLKLLELKKKSETSANINLAAKLAVEHTYVVAQKILSQPYDLQKLAKLISSLALCQDVPAYSRDEMLKSYGIRAQDWYMNTQLKPDASSPHASYRTAGESFNFGAGAMDHLLISQLIQGLPAIDTADFARHRDTDGAFIEAIYKAQVSSLMPAHFFTPLLLGNGELRNPPKAWCESFLAKYEVKTSTL